MGHLFECNGIGIFNLVTCFVISHHSSLATHVIYLGLLVFLYVCDWWRLWKLENPCSITLRHPLTPSLISSLNPTVIWGNSNFPQTAKLMLPRGFDSRLNKLAPSPSWRLDLFAWHENIPACKHDRLGLPSPNIAAKPEGLLHQNVFGDLDLTKDTNRIMFSSLTALKASLS